MDKTNEVKYELEIVSHYPCWWDSEICILTGLSLEEVRPVTRNTTRWTGQQYIKVFRHFGFNTNDRFVRFDRKTKYPCMIRCRVPNVKSHWAGFIYYDGHIYHPEEGKLTWAEWNSLWPNYKVTSMLQVWIGTDQKLNEITDK